MPFDNMSPEQKRSKDKDKGVRKGFGVVRYGDRGPRRGEQGQKSQVSKGNMADNKYDGKY